VEIGCEGVDGGGGSGGVDGRTERVGVDGDGPC